MIDEVSAGLNPARYVAGLGRAAMKAGASIFENTRVQGVQRESRQGEAGWRLVTSRGAIWVHEVFVATSGYTGAATPALRKKIIPIGSFIITTEILPEKLAHDLSPRKRMIYDSKNYLYYYRLTPDLRMLFGGRAAFFPENDQTIRRSAEILRRGMVSVYPQLRDAKIDYVWGGTLDFAFDIMPHAGQIDGMYYALGYAGHGVAMATYQGQKMAEMIAGDKPDNPFVGIPFPGAPLGMYNGRPWFLPWLRRSPFSDLEDPIAHMVELISKRAIVEGHPLTQDEQRFLAAEKINRNPLLDDFQPRVKRLIELILDSEVDSHDPKSLSNSLEWASDFGYSNVAAMIEEVCVSRAENFPKLHGRKWIADRVQLVGCGVLTVILLTLLVASIEYLFSGK
jgi:hypothetical protein